MPIQQLKCHSLVLKWYVHVLCFMPGYTLKVSLWEMCIKFNYSWSPCEVTSCRGQCNPLISIERQSYGFEFNFKFTRASFSKSWNYTSCFDECNFSFLKNSQVQINFKLNKKTVWLLINNLNMKNLRGGRARRSFLKPFFSHLRKLFSKVLCQIFVIVVLDVIGLENFPLSLWKSQSRIMMCNLHWC